MKNGKKHGKGKMVYVEDATHYAGEVYEGEWKDDKRDGNGKYTWPDGDVYVGEYKDGKRNGKGKYTVNSGSNKGDVYDGEFKDNNPNGYGEWTKSDGSVYHEGIWKDGAPVRFHALLTPGESVGAQLAQSGQHNDTGGENKLDKALALAIKAGHVPGQSLRYIQFADGKIYFYGPGSSVGAAGNDCFRFDPK
jgi:hypothetical protein